jgi:hypothetical protein
MYHTYRFSTIMYVEPVLVRKLPTSTFNANECVPLRGVGR